MKLSPAAFKLIIDHEVGGGEKYYNKYLSRPNWPGGESGVTIGIGYDLGYTEKARFLSDWHALEDRDRDRLLATVGWKAWRAQEMVAGLKNIVIPWAMAVAVFEVRTVPYWINQTLSAFPGADRLPPDAFGALVSLVFNRGPSMGDKNKSSWDRRAEMRAIRALIPSGNLKAIAGQIRSMKRLWNNGLVARREAEADLLENAK